MPKSIAKSRAVAFKVEPELAEFLSALPNRSEFIRRAILSGFDMKCPLCTGTGVVPRGVGEHFAPILTDAYRVVCTTCEITEAIPADADALPLEEQSRWEQFFRSGGYLCQACFRGAALCVECGWHLPEPL